MAVTGFMLQRDIPTLFSSDSITTVTAAGYFDDLFPIIFRGRDQEQYTIDAAGRPTSVSTIKGLEVPQLIRVVLGSVYYYLVVTQITPTVLTTLVYEKELHDRLDTVEGGAIPDHFAITLSDEYTVLPAASTTVPLATFHAPYALAVTDVKATLTTVGTGAALVTVDIHVAGTSILSTKITIDASEKTSAFAVSLPVLVTSPTNIASNALIECFLDVRDTDNNATGLKVWLIGTQI